MAALNAIAGLPRHVVAQIVEAELVVGAVGDVGEVLLASLGRVLTRNDDSGGHAQRAIDAAHKLTLISGEVVVDRHHVNASTGDGVEVRGERGHEGLTLTGLHLRDVAEVERRATHDLHVEVTQADGAFGCLSNGREGLGEHVVEGLARGKPLTEVCGFAAQFLVGERRKGLFESVDSTRQALQFAEGAPLAHAQNKIKN